MTAPTNTITTMIITMSRLKTIVDAAILIAHYTALAIMIPLVFAFGICVVFGL